MHNVHEREPVVFESRWAMSYLRGPLTRSEIQRLTPKAAEDDSAGRPPASPRSPATPSANRPIVPPGITQVFLPPRSPAPAGHRLHYEPVVLSLGSFVVDDRAIEAAPSRAIAAAAPFTDGAPGVDWDAAEVLALTEEELAHEPDSAASFGSLPPSAIDEKSYAAWKREFVTWVTGTQALTAWKSPSLGQVSDPGEDERDFRIRLQQIAREKRDAERAKLEERFGAKAARLRERVRKAEQALAREQGQARKARLDTAVSVGATVIGALFGRRSLGRATTASRGVGRSIEQAGDVGRAAENLEALRKELAELDAALQAEIRDLDARIDPLAEPLGAIRLRPEKDDVTVRLVALGWLPWWSGPGGERVPATTPARPPSYRPSNAAP
jgi:hypothetical protein